jgi:hypothetical protein
MLALSLSDSEKCDIDLFLSRRRLFEGLAAPACVLFHKGSIKLRVLYVFRANKSTAVYAFYAFYAWWLHTSNFNTLNRRISMVLHDLLRLFMTLASQRMLKVPIGDSCQKEFHAPGFARLHSKDQA